MSKADGDSRAPGAAGGGRDAASPALVESKNVKPATSTVQEDIPPVHVLEAAEKQERKETEDLLSGFDRPSRGPKSTPKERDFVDYYARKSGVSGADSGSERASGAEPLPGAMLAAGAKAREESTVIVRRKTDGAPAWLVWGGAAMLMLLVGGLVAFLATADGRPEATAASAAASPAASAVSAVSAATTLTGATTPKPTAADENIPPPAAVSPEASEAVTVEPAPAVAPRGSAKRDPRAAASAPAVRGTSTAEAPKAAPREDFIRDL